LFCDAGETSVLASIFFSNAQTIRLDEFCLALRERIPALAGAEFVAEGLAGKRGPVEPPRTVAQWGATSLSYHAAGFDYRVDHGAFFQVNRWLVDGLADRVTDGQEGMLAWDLFAGVGLFARQLTASFSRVVAVESAPSATPALAANLKGTSGAAVRVTTRDFLRGRKAKRADRTVPDLIVVDPPRIGLGPEITTLLGEVAAPALTYVSCDPATLARDLKALTGSGYAIKSITLADLFPQTFHLETVVELQHR
jgi:23S rRNA (uracil1939-C5)-methyltransferase